MNSPAAIPIDDTPFPTITFGDDAVDALPGAPRISTTLSADDTTAAIEALPRLTVQIIQLWNTRELNTLIHRILLDTSDGKRQGFPHEVAKELMFLAKLNVLTRAYEAAPLLGTTLAEACRLIENGDHAALGYSDAPIDIWGVGERPKNAAPGGPQVVLDFSCRLPENHLAALSPALVVDPTIPNSACLDLTTSHTLRHDKPGLGSDDCEVMDQGFFRCIAKELGNLKIPQLVLSDLGRGKRCHWLPAAIGFTKKHCNFPTVMLHTDPLSADEAQLVLAMGAGLDHLLINLNLASSQWRAQAETNTESDPEYFQHLIQRLIRNRDEITANTGHRCTISVIQIDHKSVFHLSRSFMQLGKEDGLEPFRHVSDGKRGENTGKCRCWSPFIEAHVRTNGHLVACAQDHSGHSFTADLKATTFTEAWHGQTFRNLRQRTLHGEKPGRLCEICPHHVAEKTSQPATPKPATFPSLPGSH